MDKYPKFYKTMGQMQNGKIGQMRVTNGLIEVLTEEQEQQLQSLQSFKDGGIFLVGFNKTVEVTDDGKIKKPPVPNRFADVFTEQELININLIPDDVFEETVLFNIRQIAKEYALADSGLADSSQLTADSKSESDNEEQKAKILPMTAFKSKEKLQMALEELGVLYPKKAKMQELYELYTKNVI